MAADDPSPVPKPSAAPTDALHEAFTARRPVEGKVVAIVRGGYEVALPGVVAFCPFANIDVRNLNDQLSFLNQTYPFAITEYKAGGKRIEVSRRRLLEAEERRKAKQAERETRARIQAGDVLEGKVAALTEFGAFVDLGGVMGMIHVSEISHERVARPADRLKVGDPVKVRVLQSDPAKKRIALSLKALEEDPWDAARARLKPQTVVLGRLVRVTEFGVFVELAPAVDGLLHASELPPGRLAVLREQVANRPEIPVLVLKLEPGRKRVALAPAPEGAAPGTVVPLKQVQPRSIVTAPVESVDAAGLHVRIGPGQVGLIPPAETGTARGVDLRRAFPPGTMITALVLDSEKGERGLRLSIRKAERKEQRDQLDEYRRSTSAASSGSFATLGDFFRKSS